MSLTHELVKTEMSKLGKVMCRELGATDEGKKFSLLMLKKLSGYKKSKLDIFYSDGSGDHQIDGVYVVEDDNVLQINILTCVYRSNGKNFEDKDVTDLINNGIPYLIFGEEKAADINSRLKNIKKELDELRKEYEDKIVITVKFINTSENVLSSNGESIFTRFQADLQSKNLNIDLDKINDKEIAALFSLKSALKTPMPIKLSGRSYYTLSTREGFVCRLPVQEVLNIYFGFKDGEKEYPGYGDFLFEDNVRRSLGLEKKINKNIYNTATNSVQAGDFEYFNNGLTLIYDEKSGSIAGDSPIIYVKGLQVVNGCQTVNALIKASDNKTLIDDVYVTCRFIKRSDDSKFIQSVITYTNSQNAISDRDLHANDPIQYSIQKILRNLGVFYERKLNEHREEEDDARMDALDAAQAYLCCELQEPHNAKQKKRELFNISYHRIFDSSKDDLAYMLFLSHNIWEYVIEKQLEHRRKKRNTKKLGKTPKYRLSDLIIAHGSYHVATRLYEKFFHGIPLQDKKKSATNFKYPSRLDEEYKNALHDLEKVIRDRKINKGTLPQFFKSTGKCI